MRKLKKYVGVALCTAMAVTALPVRGSFVRPAVVRAADTFKNDTALEGKIIAVATGYGKVLINGIENTNLAGVFTGDNAYKYAWVPNDEVATIKTKFSGTEGVHSLTPDSIQSGSVSIDRTGVVDENLVLAIVKTKDVNWSQDDLTITGITFSFTRAAAPTEEKVKFDSEGNIVATSDYSLEYLKKTVASVSAEDKKSDTEAYSQVGNGKIMVENPAHSTDSDYYLIRTAASGFELASEAMVISTKKIKTSDLLSLKYKINQKENKLVITKESILGLFESGKKRGTAKVDITAKDSTAGSSPQTDLEIKKVTEDVEYSVKDGDKVELYTSDAASKVTIKIEKLGDIAENTVKAEGKMIVGLKEKAFYYKKKTEDATKYMLAETENITVADGEYTIKKVPTGEDAKEKTVETLGEDGAITLKIPSDEIPVKVTGNAVEEAERKAKEKARKEAEAAEQAAEEAMRAEAAKKAEEAKKDETKKDETKKEEAKKDETKKDETKVEETKKDETKTEESKKEESKSEEPTEEVKPVTEKAGNSKKATVTASAKKVETVLEAEAGKLTIAAKKATVTLSKEVLEAVFSEKAEAVKVSVKTAVQKKDSKDVKAIVKYLKKNKLASKTLFNVDVKVGKEKLGKFDLKGEKLTLTLKTTLKKAPKNLHVMNVANGKLMKAKFKAGRVTFKAGEVGKFVLVIKK